MAVKILILYITFCLFRSASSRPADGLVQLMEEQLERTRLQEDGVHWAVLVAGSYTWPNYRHQSDICHAYQVLKKHGIPDERIIVMMTDDIAGHPANPTPGRIYNHPNGPNVYEGVPKDYTGTDQVTPTNFMNILKGEEMRRGSKKTLKSGPNDHVFINFVDHGAPGLIGFPHKRMYAKDLIRTIEEMHSKNMYKKLVFYMESCNSGSMFDGLLSSDLNVYVTTAANPKESSYSCYYDRRRRTFLGDLYSVSWMENSDASNLGSETLQQQFEIVKKETNVSHVMEYGDMEFSSDPLDQYQGGAEQLAHAQPYVPPFAPRLPVPSPDAELTALQYQLEDATNARERRDLLQQIQQIEEMRGRVRATMKHVAALATANHVQAARVLEAQHSLTQHDCYQQAVEAFHQHCFDLNEVDYALRHLYVLVNLCEEQIRPDMLAAIFKKVCF